MTAEKLLEVFSNYENGMRNAGVSACRNATGRDIPAFRLPHARWMCLEALDFVQTGRIEKAMRWLGFVQGILWCEGVFRIDELKRHNMPEVIHEETP